MDFFEWFFWQTWQIFYLLGFIGVLTVPLLLVLFWKKWLPAPARTLFWASRRHTPPLLLVHDSGRGELTTVMERKGEGIVITKEHKYKILPRVMPRFATEDQVMQQIVAHATQPQPSQQPEPAEQDDAQTPALPLQPAPQAPEQTAVGKLVEKVRDVVSLESVKLKFILDYSDWILKRCMLVGLGLPLFVGYTGKLCLLNPEALALYEMGDMAIQTEDTVLFNPNGVKGKKVEDAYHPLLLLDPRKIQQVISSGFDQSQIAGVVQDSEELARLGMGMSKRTMAIIMILVVVLVLGLGMFLLPQILPKQG